jgi:hypothetical protein
MKYLFLGAAFAVAACGPTVAKDNDDGGVAGIDASNTTDQDGDGYP